MKLAVKEVHEIGGQTHPLEMIWEQLIKRKFPQVAPANVETSFLLEIGDFSRKFRLRCSCQFPWCALAPSFSWSALLCRVNICECAHARACLRACYLKLRIVRTWKIFMAGK
jgi:hypothetical protein